MQTGRTLRRAGVLGAALSLFFLGPAWAGESVTVPEFAEEMPRVASGAPNIVPRFALRHGGRRIESGLRVETTSRGVFVSSTMLPLGGEPRGVALPEHLGGGYIFYQSSGQGATDFYRSETWTGELTPVARIPFPVRHVEAGFDRLYLFGVTVRTALDPQTGEVLSLDPLPPLVTIEGLSFDGSRRAVVHGPLSGTYYTRDAGVSWKPLRGARGVLVDLAGSSLLVETEGGLAVVQEHGELEEGSGRSQSLQFGRLLSDPDAVPAERSRVATSASSADPDEFVGGDARERAWTEVLTRGARLGDLGVAISEGVLLSVRLDASLELTTRPTTVPATARCVASGARDATGKGPAPIVICQGHRTQVLALLADREKGVQARIVWEPGRLREVLSFGAGAVLLSGSCESQVDSTDRVCVVDARGSKTHRLPSGMPSERTRIAYAVSPQAAWVIWIDKKSDSIRAIRLGEKATKAWKLPRDHAVAELVRAGSFLPRASLIQDELSVWVVQRENLVGMRLHDGGEPSFGAVQRPLERALFDGPRAVIWGAAGFAKQSLDGGQTFAELSLPYRSGDPELSSVASPSSAVLMGCSELGCALGRLLRFGWEETAQDSVSPPVLAQTPPTGDARFLFRCAGDLRSPRRKETGASSFPNFWEVNAPTREKGYEGSSIGFTDGALRLYAWGPMDANWGRAGRTQVFFVDPWDPEAVHKTAPTLQLFTSATDAKAGLGLAQPATSFHYHSMDPSGLGGLLILRGASTTDFMAFAEGKALERFSGAHELGFRDLAGVVLSGGQWVAAFRRGEILSVARFVSGRIEVFAELPLGESGQRGVELVRTESGALGVAMDGDDGLFVFPLSDAGVLGEPIIVTPMRHRPPACPPEASGYIVDRELSVAPYLETRDGAPLAVNQVRARLVVGLGGVCLEGLSGRARDLSSTARASAGPNSVPFSILDTDSKGNRVRLLCE